MSEMDLRPQRCRDSSLQVSKSSTLHRDWANSTPSCALKAKLGWSFWEQHGFNLWSSVPCVAPNFDPLIVHKRKEFQIAFVSEVQAPQAPQASGVLYPRAVEVVSAQAPIKHLGGFQGYSKKSDFL